MRSYDRDRTYKRAVARFGEPTLCNANSARWRFGKSWLCVGWEYPASTFCYVSAHIHSRTHYAGRRNWTLNALFRAFRDSIVIRLASYPDRLFALAFADDGTPEIRASDGFTAPVPASHARLCRATLEGELEPELFLDAIMHDTELIPC